MTWQDYQLDNTTLKANEPITLWKTENGLIEIKKSTLAKPITLDDRRKGYYSKDKANYFWTQSSKQKRAQ
jgi:hypothetical protein